MPLTNLSTPTPTPTVPRLQHIDYMYCTVELTPAQFKSRVNAASMLHSTYKDEQPSLISHRFISPPAQAWMHALRGFVDTRLGGQDVCRISARTVAPKHQRDRSIFAGPRSPLLCVCLAAVAKVYDRLHLCPRPDNACRAASQ